MEPILEVRGISKKFSIDHQRKSYLTVRDRMTSFFQPALEKEDFWALRDVSFSINPGDCLGIIGKNGAGKSTLLKILSKITPPTEGKIIGRGRLASLLEVGTGFHPELSGRENVYLNGSILGMKKKEVNAKFDEIIDFAGTEQFLDTPLKHYSSGMQMRLAFAVAAFLEPEILIIDEVLAVGDAEFQRKCLGKMEDVARSGRTVLFVSHSMTAIQSLCTKTLFIDKGVSSEVLTVAEGVHRYLAGNIYSKTGQEVYQENVPTKRAARLITARLLNERNAVTNQLLTCEPFYVEIKWENNNGVRITPSIELVNYDGVKLFWSGDTATDWDGSLKMEKGAYVSRVRIPPNFLKAGEYSFILGLYTQSPYEYHHIILNTLHCSVIDPMDKRCLARGEMTSQFEKFMLLPSLDWINEKTS